MKFSWRILRSLMPNEHPVMNVHVHGLPNPCPQIGPVLKYIEDLAQGMDGKFIVFFRHRLVRQAIEAKLVALKLKYICIAGDVPSGIRGVKLFF